MDYSYQSCPLSKFVLPASFGDALSYYEQVCKLLKAYNSLVDFVNKSLQGFEDNSKAYTDQKIAEAKVEFDKKAYELQVAYDQFIEQTDNNLQALTIAFNQLRNDMAAEIVGVNARTDAAIAQNNEYIFEKIGQELIDAKVVNYFTGEMVTLQEMFDYLAQFHLTNALDYTTLAARNNTYTQFAALNITYTQLATYGGTLVPQE